MYSQVCNPDRWRQGSDRQVPTPGDPNRRRYLVLQHTCTGEHQDVAPVLSHRQQGQG